MLSELCVFLHRPSTFTLQDKWKGKKTHKEKRWNRIRTFRLTASADTSSPLLNMSGVPRQCDVIMLPVCRPNQSGQSAMGGEECWRGASGFFKIKQRGGEEQILITSPWTGPRWRARIAPRWSASPARRSPPECRPERWLQGSETRQGQRRDTDPTTTRPSCLGSRSEPRNTRLNL